MINFNDPAWIAIGNAQRDMVARMRTESRRFTCDYRELDLELDLISARYAPPFYAPVDEMEVAVPVCDYLATDLDAQEDMTESLQHYFSRTSLMPGVWGTPLCLPSDDEEPTSEWSGGFCDNN